jgi:hypothetical protein
MGFLGFPRDLSSGPAELSFGLLLRHASYDCVNNSKSTRNTDFGKSMVTLSSRLVSICIPSRQDYVHIVNLAVDV